MIEQKIIASSTLNIEFSDDLKNSKIVSSLNELTVKGQLPFNIFFDKEMLPTQVGSLGITDAFINGLVANIHYAHERGYTDSAMHLRHIIKRLEDGFISIGKLHKYETDKITGEIIKGEEIK